MAMEQALTIVRGDVVPPDERQAIVQFIDQKRDLIRRNLAPKATDIEFELWIEECKFRALNPLARHIYLIPYGNKHVTQVSIDGLRLIAARTGEYAGCDAYEYDTESEKNPNKATCTVYRLIQGQRMAFTASVFWAERNKGRDNWVSQPYHMLGKCAESAALRKAFPEECGGLYSDDEMGEAYAAAPEREVRAAGKPVQVARPPSGGSSRQALRASVQRQPAPEEPPVDAESVYGVDAEGNTPPFSPATAALLDELNDLAGRGFLLDEYLRKVHPNKTVDELTDEQLTAAVERGRGAARRPVGGNGGR
jgi:phage recombination protein Bet